MMDYRFKLIRNQENHGLTKNLNRLLFESKGYFLARMDADDISTHDRIFKQLIEMADNKETVVCGGNFISISQNGEQYVNLPLTHDLITSSFLFFNPIPHPFSFFRGSFFKEFQIRYNERFKFAQDYALWIQLFLKYKQCKFANINSIVGYYRHHDKQISSKKFKEQLYYATLAQRMIFNALGISLNNPLVSMHKYIYLSKPVLSESSAYKLLEWVNLLLKSNISLKIFPEEAFNSVMIEKISMILNQSYDSPLIQKKFDKILNDFS